VARILVEGMNNFWTWLRQVSGDAAYDNYLRSQRKRARLPECNHGAPQGACAVATLSREKFYLDSLRRRYTGVSRCC